MEKQLTLILIFLVTTSDLCAMKFGEGWIAPKRSELTLGTIKSDLEGLVVHLCVRRKQTNAERAIIGTLKQKVVYTALESSRGLRFENPQDLNFHAQENVRYVLAQAITEHACTLYKKRFTKKVGTLCRRQEKRLAQTTENMRHDWQQYLYHVAIRGQKGTLAKYMDDRLKKRIKKMVKKDLQKQKQKTSSNRNSTL